MTEQKKCPWVARPWEEEKGGKDWNVFGPKLTNHYTMGRYGPVIDDDLAGQYGDKAEAQKIAAALEMFDALSNSLSLLQALSGPDDAAAQAVIEQAAAALRKARGETSEEGGTP